MVKVSSESAGSSIKQRRRIRKKSKGGPAASWACLVSSVVGGITVLLVLVMSKATTTTSMTTVITTNDSSSTTFHQPQKRGKLLKTAESKKRPDLRNPIGVRNVQTHAERKKLLHRDDSHAHSRLGGVKAAAGGAAAANAISHQKDPLILSLTDNNNSNNHPPKIQSQYPACPYMTLNDLTPNELLPVANADNRHMITPPHGGKLSLVCCQTTKGPWNILVHEKWTPNGARRFLDMVTSGYFSLQKQGVPLMRCVSQFLCQFGLNGAASSQFAKALPDEPNWLPQGPAHRQNAQGVKRFQKGYFAYAGSGPNSRSNQLFVALKDNAFLAGGSPWEIPWGELVGRHSYETLDKIYTGYGENGPSQQWLHRHDSSDSSLAKDFPLLDYVTACEVVNEMEQQSNDA